jgi:hypothetical protein
MAKSGGLMPPAQARSLAAWKAASPLMSLYLTNTRAYR